MFEQNFGPDKDENDAACDEQFGTEFGAETRTDAMGNHAACKRRAADEDTGKQNGLSGAIETESHGAGIDARGESREKNGESGGGGGMVVVGGFTRIPYEFYAENEKNSECNPMIDGFYEIR